ncbi:hypothetical protein H5410_051310 [Solanum commersonii]|uniref:Polyprotein protein n=1 Tax=Solanum commersonii TaxID=4109 RepID=A0A9J5WY14_SOLCO|nr:hypothetical protein H5410_051310 [Solanum commersonii]
MGHLAHSADMRATRLEAAVPWMIESAILAALTPLQTSIDDLMGESFEVTTLKAEVANLRKDVDNLKSTDFTSVLEATDDVDAPTKSEIPPVSTRDVLIDDMVADESEAETDEEKIEVPEETIYGDLPVLEEMIVLQISLTETSMAGPSGSNIVDVTPGTDAQDQSIWIEKDVRTLMCKKERMCQVLKEKIKSVRERSSRWITEWFRDAVLDHPKLQTFEDAEGQDRKAMKLAKGHITEWIGELDLLHRMTLHNIFLATINTFLNSLGSYFHYIKFLVENCKTSEYGDKFS